MPWLAQRIRSFVALQEVLPAELVSATSTGVPLICLYHDTISILAGNARFLRLTEFENCEKVTGRRNLHRLPSKQHICP